MKQCAYVVLFMIVICLVVVMPSSAEERCADADQATTSPSPELEPTAKVSDGVTEIEGDVEADFSEWFTEALDGTLYLNACEDQCRRNYRRCTSNCWGIILPREDPDAGDEHQACEFQCDETHQYCLSQC